MDIDNYVSDLEAQRAKIDAAITAFRALRPTTTKAPTVATVVALPVRRRQRFTRLRKMFRNGIETTPSATLRLLKRTRGPHTTATITDALPEFAGLNGTRAVRYTNVHNGLLKLNAKGRVRRNGLKQWEFVK